MIVLLDTSKVFPATKRARCACIFVLLRLIACNTALIPTGLWVALLLVCNCHLLAPLFPPCIPASLRHLLALAPSPSLPLPLGLCFSLSRSHTGRAPPRSCGCDPQGLAASGLLMQDHAGGSEARGFKLLLNRATQTGVLRALWTSRLTPANAILKSSPRTPHQTPCRLRDACALDSLAAQVTFSIGPTNVETVHDHDCNKACLYCSLKCALSGVVSSCLVKSLASSYEAEETAQTWAP